jgi:hypothetical protein
MILTYDLGSTDQTMNDSHFHVMWVVGFEVQMSRLLVYLHGHFRALLHDQDVQECKGINNFNFYCESDGKFKAVEMVMKLLLSSWSMWPNHECHQQCLYLVLVPLSREREPSSTDWAQLSKLLPKLSKTLCFT